MLKNKFLVSKKQKELLKKLGCLMYDKKITKQEASKLIDFYKQQSVRGFFGNIKHSKQNYSYIKTTKKYFEANLLKCKLPTEKQRINLRRLGYLYWNSPSLTFQTAQKFSELLWKQKNLQSPGT